MHSINSSSIPNLRKYCIFLPFFWKPVQGGLASDIHFQNNMQRFTYTSSACTWHIIFGSSWWTKVQHTSRTSSLKIWPLDNPRIMFYVTDLWKLIMVVVFNTIYDVFDLCLSNDRQLVRWRKVSSSQRRGRRSRAPSQALRRNATCPWHASVLHLMHHLLALNALRSTAIFVH